MRTEQAATAVAALMLCPCCCTLEDLLAFERAHEADAPRVGGPPLTECRRCGFTFPSCLSSTGS